MCLIIIFFNYYEFYENNKKILLNYFNKLMYEKFQLIIFLYLFISNINYKVGKKIIKKTLLLIKIIINIIYFKFRIHSL